MVGEWCDSRPMIVKARGAPNVVAVCRRTPMEPYAAIALVTFLVAYGTLATEKINRTVVVGAGSLVLLITGVLTLAEAINYVNWETIGLLFGMFIIVVVLSDAGFFSYVAFILAKRLNYNPRAMLIVFSLLAGLLASFVNSITVMLFLAAITIEIARLVKIDPVPLVVAEVVVANIGGASTLIGDPPNVILGTQLGFGFNEFVRNNGPIALAAALLAVGVLYLTQRTALTPSATVDTRALSRIAPESAIISKRMLRLGIAALIAAVVLLVSRSYLETAFAIPLNIALAALIPAFVLLLVSRGGAEDTLKKIDYELLLFFIGLFVLVGGLEQTGIIGVFATGLAGASMGNNTVLLSLLLFGSAFISGLIDNVPFAVTMSYVIRDLALIPSVLATALMVWVVSLGTDIGGNLTPIGASANVVAYSSLETHGVRMGWVRWIKIALPPTVAALILCDLLLYVKYVAGFY
jgi:Na+/H+ antiporter NhaD/arsenite permease-like protein